VTRLLRQLICVAVVCVVRPSGETPPSMQGSSSELAAALPTRNQEKDKAAKVFLNITAP
jgi:hypothetical protein